MSFVEQIAEASRPIIVKAINESVTSAFQNASFLLTNEIDKRFAIIQGNVSDQVEDVIESIKNSFTSLEVFQPLLDKVVTQILSVVIRNGSDIVSAGVQAQIALVKADVSDQIDSISFEFRRSQQIVIGLVIGFGVANVLFNLHDVVWKRVVMEQVIPLKKDTDQPNNIEAV